MCSAFRAEPASLQSSEQRPGSECALERGHHAVAREGVLVAEKAHDPIDIASLGVDTIVVAHVGLEIDLSKPNELRSKHIADLRRHLVDRAEALDERDGLLRSDPFDAGMEVCADQQA